jgi:ABC-2 type transport system permease protein
VLIVATALLFVDYEIAHPLWMLWFLVLTAVIFSLFGFVLGIWVDGFEKLQVVPLLMITPLTFLGGSFYSIGMLPPIWAEGYLISGFRWSFYGLADVGVGISVGMTLAFAGVRHRRVVDLQDRVSAEELRVNGGQHRALVRHG